MTPPESVRRHFLSWEQPLLPQAVSFLARDWDGEGPLDLARLLVIVPTRQSGRRLREALAEHAAARDQAAFPPRVLTPEALVNLNGVAGIASRLESLLAWTEIFRTADLAQFREVFPIDPPTRSFSWALRLAHQFARLQATLAEAGLAMRDVIAKAGDFPEGARWLQLGDLEKLHAERLAALGLRDAQAAKIEAANSPSAGFQRWLQASAASDITSGTADDRSRRDACATLPNVDRIVILATPDPMPLALTMLGAVARALTVDVVIYAPASEAAAFDGWGRPVEAEWISRVIELPDFANRVHLCADPEAQTDWIVTIARGDEAPDTVVGIGVADTEVLPLLENALTRAGLPAFNPEGRPRRQDGLYALVAALAELAAMPSFDAAAALLRCPDVLEWLRSRAGKQNFSPATVLLQLDELRSRHLPASLAVALAVTQRSAEAASGSEEHGPAAGARNSFGPIRAALEALIELRAILTSGTFPENAAAALTTIFSDRRIDPTAPLAESAVAWTETLREAGEALAEFGGAGLSLAESWEFVLGEFAEQMRTSERPAGALDLLGWLELLWDDAPHLVIAGFNDGCVPDAVVGDAFLPESLRVKLDLKTNAARLARDAYLLTAIVAWRGGNNAGISPASGIERRQDGGATQGRLDLLFGKTSVAGEPLRPSRLLLRCADAELPARVMQLFRPAVSARPNLPWERAWQLRPPCARALERISVTALRDYLACPFRFYLKHALKMERIDPEKAELDARDFGTLLHAALQQLGENEGLRDCTDAAILRDFLLARFEATARERYGAELTLPLVVQFESARQRLRAAAIVEAGERAAGWRTERVEWKFSFPVAGLTISGKIDRIDRHADGRVRVLDYKTGDTAAEPGRAHLRLRRADDETPEFARLMLNGREFVWRDLQLPLYLRALDILGFSADASGERQLEFVGLNILCGYFNLPKAVSETAVSLWEEYSRELQVAADRCAEGIVAAVANREFWPPNENVRAEWDEFAEMFHHGAADSVEWSSAVLSPAAKLASGTPALR